MRHNICSPREDGDYDILVSVEDDTLGAELAEALCVFLQERFSNLDDEGIETVVILTEESHLLDKSLEPSL